MNALVLAAGKGKRLTSVSSEVPKVLFEVNGKPLIDHALDMLSAVQFDEICIIVGYKKEKIIKRYGDKYTYAVQIEQLGTGHAVMTTEPLFAHYNGDILVMYGDMPLFRSSSVRDFINVHERSRAHCTIMTACYDDPPEYGRIIRDEFGHFLDIIEAPDCSIQQRAFKEVNVGMYIFNGTILFDTLKLLHNNNAQREYYLTDVPCLMQRSGFRIATYTLVDNEEAFGVNTPEDIRLCETIFEKRNSTMKGKRV